MRPASIAGAQTVPRLLGTGAALVLLILSKAFAQQGATSDLEGKLAANVAHFDAHGRTLVEAVVELAYEHQLPVGFEYVDRAAARHRLDLTLTDTPLREVIAALVGSLPEYRIAFSGGTVQIYSPHARADPANLLNTTIRGFQTRDEEVLDASADLWGWLLAEVRPGGPGYGGDVHHGVETSEGRRVTLQIRSAKVYEILNAMVAADGASMWSVTVPPQQLSTLRPDLWHVFSLDPPAKELGLRLAIRAMEGIFPNGE